MNLATYLRKNYSNYIQTTQFLPSIHIFSYILKHDWHTLIFFMAYWKYNNIHILAEYSNDDNYYWLRTESRSTVQVYATSSYSTIYSAVQRSLP